MNNNSRTNSIDGLAPIGEPSLGIDAILFELPTSIHRVASIELSIEASKSSIGTPTSIHRAASIEPSISIASAASIEELSVEAPNAIESSIGTSSSINNRRPS